jgi:hypothetical protein
MEIWNNVMIESNTLKQYNQVGSYFVQLGFNLSNGVTDKLESSSILIYLFQVKGTYIQKVFTIKRSHWLKQEINKEEPIERALLLIN